MIYYKISNADHKIWIMPKHNMRVGMMLYQPSALKGHLFKNLFPFLSCCKPVKDFLHVEEVESPIAVDFQKKLECVFSASNLEYAYFGGTPGAHKKATIQVYKGKNVLGYCKITENKDIYALFQHEEKILKELESKKVVGVPRCLYCGEWKDGEYLFAQTTVKTPKSKVEHTLSSKVTSFLKNLKSQTSVKCKFSETDEYEWILRLEQNLNMLSVREQDILCRGIVVLKQYFGDELHTFSAYHGDFTPWNMFLENGKLFVFDFEYAGLRYIPCLDIMHHITQTGIFESGWNVDDEYHNFENERDSLHMFFKNVKIAYIAYLVDETAKFVCREKDGIPESTQRLLNIWIPLLNKLL